MRFTGGLPDGEDDGGGEPLGAGLSAFIATASDTELERAFVAPAVESDLPLPLGGTAESEASAVRRVESQLSMSLLLLPLSPSSCRSLALRAAEGRREEEDGGGRG